MYDRNDYDLRIWDHQRRIDTINRRSWHYTTPPLPAPRQSLATLLRALAARLDPAPSAPPLETTATTTT